MTQRHAGKWAAGRPAAWGAVERVARASIEVNVGLAAVYHKQPVPWGRLATALAALGVADWHRLLRDSRLWERVSARVRAGFARAG